jgi:hypothetical protein
MLPWSERPTIEIDLARPLNRRYADVPKEAFTSGRRLLDAVMHEIPGVARFVADWARLRTANRFQAEAVTLAGQVGVGWREIMLANLSYDLVLARMGCSTVALPTPSGPVLARNMDWWPEDVLAQTSYLIRCSQHGQLRFANAGWPGAIGVVSGLSGRGFALVLNAVTCPEGIRKTGYPVLLHLRRVLEDAQDFDDALHMLTDQTLAAPALVTLVGIRNDQRVVVERTPTRHAHRRPHGDEPLLATNDYRLLSHSEQHGVTGLYETTCSRYDALCRFFAGHRADREVEDAALLYALSDSEVIQGITAQHIILRPRRGEARLFVPTRLVSAAPEGGSTWQREPCPFPSTGRPF